MVSELSVLSAICLTNIPLVYIALKIHTGIVKLAFTKMHNGAFLLAVFKRNFLHESA